MKRARNFNAGPAALPEEVLVRAEKEFRNINDSGMSVMELSHRSSIFENIHNHAIQGLKDLMEIPENYEVLLLQGGASLQFSMIPMNLLPADKHADYILTGSWSEKALKEAEKVGETKIVASSKDGSYKFIPKNDLSIDESAAYLHITSNNTIYGTQWSDFPSTQSLPLVADMSSDILSRKIDVSKFGLIYAGAQKNLGPSGVTVVIIRKDLIQPNRNDLPSMLDYSIHAKSNSLYNTPPTMAIYLLSLVMDWVKQQGGVKAIEEINRKKANLIYAAIDESDDFYIGHAETESRSKMNITFNLPTEAAEKLFLQQASDAGFVGLAGHRSIGGCRASIYNAVPLAHCEELATFMKDFQKTYSENN